MNAAWPAQTRTTPEHPGTRLQEGQYESSVATFSGQFVRFDAVRVNPKPVRGRRIPVVVGGNSDAALGRAAAIGDGWYGFNLPAGAVTGRIATLAESAGSAAAP